MSAQLLADGMHLASNSSAQQYGDIPEGAGAPGLPPPVLELHALRSLSFGVTLVSDLAELRKHAAALHELAGSASEPNVFYEPWMLLPALETFGQKSSFAFVLIFGRREGLRPLLCGFFPLEMINRYRGLPLRVARLWSYLHFYSCAPLIRKGCERQCMEALLQWFRSGAGECSLVEFGSLPAEGPLARALVEVINELELPRYIPELYTRALLRRTSDAETCIRSALPGRRLKEFNRVRRRLAEQGSLVFEHITPEANLSEWINGFLALEAQGWKGKAGTALAATTDQREFFAECVREAFARDQLMMLRLRLDDRTLAYKCNFLRPPGAFAFKIAYDENYASYSPGVHLELENIRRFHALGQAEWMDSCAAPGHFMANHLWADRKMIQTTVVAVRGWFNGLQLSMLPFLKWAKRSGSAITAQNEAEPKEDL